MKKTSPLEDAAFEYALGNTDSYKAYIEGAAWHKADLETANKKLDIALKALKAIQINEIHGGENEYLIADRALDKIDEVRI